MKIIYNNKKVEKICENTVIAIKELGKETAIKLGRLLDNLKAFTNLYEMYSFPQYRMHPLQGNRKYQYAFVIQKGTKWRLIVYPLDDEGNILKDKENEKAMFIKAVKVDILEVSEHYD